MMGSSNKIEINIILPNFTLLKPFTANLPTLLAIAMKYKCYSYGIPYNRNTYIYSTHNYYTNYYSRDFEII